MKKHGIGYTPEGKLFTPKRKKGIADTTPIVPTMVADSVVAFFNGRMAKPVLTREHADRLAAHAEMIYAHNEDFKKRVNGRGSKGRDFLYTFMEHWTQAILQAEFPAEFAKLRQYECGIHA